MLVLSRGGGGIVNRIQFQQTTTQVVHPTGTSVVSGTRISGDSANLAANDNSFMVVASAGGNATWYGNINNVPNTATMMRFRYSGRNSATRTQSFVRLQLEHRYLDHARYPLGRHHRE